MPSATSQKGFPMSSMHLPARDEILVYRIGDPDRPPVWRGKP
jgi:hypothetical protein